MPTSQYSTLLTKTGKRCSPVTGRGTHYIHFRASMSDGHVDGYKAVEGWDTTPKLHRVFAFKEL